MKHAKCFLSGAFRFALIFGATLLFSDRIYAVITSDYAVAVTAAISTDPPAVMLSWVGDPYAKTYAISRKGLEEHSWTPMVTLPGSVTNFTDATVPLGTAYEYKIEKISTGGQETWTYTGYGYIYAGGQMPLVENRAKVILLVEQSVLEPLKSELAQLQTDLVADGWSVIMDTVDRTNAVPDVKAKIKSIYSQDPANTKVLFLFGHIPVPYSGDITPDEHPPAHKGAWPADVYYADLDGTWTDNTVNDTGAERADNFNVPGDGKFDQNEIPSAVELEGGRVDLSNMTCFANKTPSLSEIDLLRRYLNKNHAFRTGSLPVQNNAILFNRFGLTEPEPLDASAWRNYSALVGTNITHPAIGQYFGLVAQNWYLWSSTLTGGASYAITYFDSLDTENNLTSSDVFALQDIRAVFATLLASWIGDWNNESNFLRAPLGSTGGVLATAYAGKPQWLFHHMAMGHTIGFATRVTQENGTDGPYLPHVPGTGQVHISLLGDPTLRAKPLPPVSGLAATQDGANVTLRWNAYADPALQGYAIYRASSSAGPYARINPVLSPASQLLIPNVTSSDSFMVRAVVLTTTPSGSYFNGSYGATVGVSGASGTTAPIQAIGQDLQTPQNQQLTITLSGSEASSSLQFLLITAPANGSLFGSGGASYTYAPSHDFHGADSFTFAVNDGKTQSSPATVNIQVIGKNHPPETQPISLSVPAGQSGTFQLAGTDVDGDALTFRVVTAPAKGELSGTPPALTYTPLPDSTGVDTFTYVDNDGQADSLPASVTITIVPVNHPPIAQDLSLQTFPGVPVAVTLTATDPDGDPLTYSLLTQPSYGQLSGTPPNLTYTPTLPAAADTFSYVANDAQSSSVTSTVLIQILPANHAPVVNGLSLSVKAGGVINLQLPASDQDGDPLTFNILGSPTKGRLSGTAPFLIYTADPGTSGQDTFTFDATDGKSESAAAMVSISITPLSLPIIGPIPDLQMQKNSSAFVNLLVTTDSGLGASLSANSDNQAVIPDATLVFNGSTLTLAPQKGATGTVAITVSASDATGSSKRNFAVTVTNTPPRASDDQVILFPNQRSIPLSLLLANDSDADGDTLTVAAVAPLSSGGNPVSLLDGQISITWSSGNADADSFTYSIWFIGKV